MMHRSSRGMNKLRSCKWKQKKLNQIILYFHFKFKIILMILSPVMMSFSFNVENWIEKRQSVQVKMSIFSLYCKNIMTSWCDSAIQYLNVSSFLLIFSLTKFSVSTKLSFDVTDVSAMTTLLGICYSLNCRRGMWGIHIYFTIKWSVESGKAKYEH